MESTRVRDGVAAGERFDGHRRSLSRRRVWGCRVVAKKLPTWIASKTDDRGVVGINLGKSHSKPGWNVWSPDFGFFTSKHKLGPSNFVVTPSSSLAGVRRCAGADDRNYCVTVDIDRRASQKLHAQATYSLVLRGDDQSSDRLVNALAALQVPLLVGDDMASWLPFRSAVPWGRLLFRIDRAAFLADPPAAVRNLTAAISPALLAQTRRLARAHLPDLLWAVPGSRVHENILRAAAATACENCWRQRPSLATPRDITVPTAVEAARRSKRAPASSTSSGTVRWRCWQTIRSFADG